MFGPLPCVTADAIGTELTLAAIEGTAIATPEKSVAPATERGKAIFMASARAIRIGASIR